MNRDCQYCGRTIACRRGNNMLLHERACPANPDIPLYCDCAEPDVDGWEMCRRCMRAHRFAPLVSIHRHVVAQRLGVVLNETRP